MRNYVNSLDWLQSGLFWRTFFFLALLVMTSMAAWLGSFKVVERTPRVQQLTAQIVSVVTITRAALTHSAPERRRELLIELASNEGIRVYLLEETDRVVEQDATETFIELANMVKAKLGSDTRFAREVNDVTGFWVSFDIEEDQYWLRLDEDRVVSASNLQFLGWAIITLVITLLGAVFISKLINEPLSQLSLAARSLAKGRKPKTLPEIGPKEIRETNASFNKMMEDLARIESDRAVILAGISHDLRTPLARMQLEVEMAELTDDARLGMQADLGQMDGIIGQFLDYAKPLETVMFETINLSELLNQVVEESSRLPDVVMRSSIGKNIQLPGNKVELRRVFNNLIENGRRYGRTPGTDHVRIDIKCGYKNREK
ncbi:MAG: HAMP domain-containing protein, partial [Burkholderiaceae bacterium]|nr:HAMP domain-containing protein [Burkholderiaceae bacterium]